MAYSRSLVWTEYSFSIAPLFPSFACLAWDHREKKCKCRCGPEPVTDSKGRCVLPLRASPCPHSSTISAFTWERSRCPRGLMVIEDRQTPALTKMFNLDAILSSHHTTMDVYRSPAWEVFLLRQHFNRPFRKEWGWGCAKRR